MRITLFFHILLFSLLFSGTSWGKQMVLDDFTKGPNLQWDYISDQVMGGVSVGDLQFVSNDNESYAQLSGKVSTDNNGGFIQFRTNLNDMDKDNIKGVYLKVRGNHQKYFVHIRTKYTLLPWQYYQGDFDVLDQWQIVKLPLDRFEPSSGWLKKSIKSKNIKSIGVVAFGRDHKADVSVAEVGFY